MNDDRPNPTQWVVPPVFLVDDDVASFDSLEELLTYVEPWDVNDEMGVFDAVGRRVVVRSEGVVRTRWTVGGGRIVVDAETSGEDASDVLAAVLRDYLALLGTERTGTTADELRDEPLPSLVVSAHRWSRCR